MAGEQVAIIVRRTSNRGYFLACCREWYEDERSFLFRTDIQSE